MLLQALSSAKTVFSSNSIAASAHADEKTIAKGDVTLWGFTIRSSKGEKVTLYCEDRRQRDCWVCTLCYGIQACGTSQYLSDRYVIDYDNPLGSGLFAVVLKAKESSTQLPVAIKVIKARAFKQYKDLINKEITVWQALGQHPHIVQLYDVYKSATRVYFVAELLPGGSLMDRLASLSSYTEADVAAIVRQLLQAVSHCHAQGVVHMDLKPENIIMQNKSPDLLIKLIDFSLATFINTPTEPGGTPEFVAPELVQNPEHYATHGCEPSIDIWALGVILYYLLSGRTPFQAADLQDIIALVKAGHWAFHPTTVWDDISVHAKDMITSMLQCNPKQRPSAAQLLEHPWLVSCTSSSSQLPGVQLSHAIKSFKEQYQSHEIRPGHKSVVFNKQGLNVITQDDVSSGDMAQEPTGVLVHDVSIVTAESTHAVKCSSQMVDADADQVPIVALQDDGGGNGVELSAAEQLAAMQKELASLLQRKAQRDAAAKVIQPVVDLPAASL